MNFRLVITVFVSLSVLSFGQLMKVHTKGSATPASYSLSTIDSITFELTTPVVPGMKFISGGTFFMGQTGIEVPIQTVTVSAFYMDTTEVTQSDYLALMGVNPSSFSTVTKGPVENMTWFDAVLYCNKRSKRDGKDTVYSYTAVSGTPGNGCTALGGLAITMTKNGYRLPTEAEWEYACRGGTTGTYYWGEATDSATVCLYCWFYINSGSTTHSVAGKLPNALGLYDMAGNVWEWNNDWYGTYVAGAVTDPTGATSGTNRVMRGGCWGYDAQYLRSAQRYFNRPPFRNGDVGFRVALPVR
jgi:formylglycine-generating enzyme required for sulfatase activity